MDERAQDADASDPTLPAEPEPDPLPPPRSLLRTVGVSAGKGVATLVSVGLLATMGYGWWTFGGVDEATVTTDVIEPEIANSKVPLDGAVDILLVGVDSRTDANGDPLPREVLDMLHAGVNEGERNTDTMILVHVPVDGTRAIAVSFPRDAWVDIAGGFGKHKLNSAFAYAWNGARKELGKTVKDPKELEAQAAAVGRKNLIATIEALIGKAVTIDRYAEVNLASFYEVTKAIGGVEVCLNEAVDEPKSGAKFPKGNQVIYGAEALAFVRQRYGLPNGDLDRIVRQQAFLNALANKVLSAEMLTSPTKVRELIGAVQRSVVLSKGWELSRFAAQMQGLTTGNIDFYTIPTQGGAKIGGADVIKVDPAEVHRFVASLTADGSAQAQREEPPDVEPTTASPTTTTTTTSTSRSTRTSQSDPDLPSPQAPGTITVSVRNASETVGLAAKVQDRLVSQGFRRGDTGDAPVATVSVIKYANGEQYNAQLVANSLGWEFALEPDLSLPAGQVRIILGTDYSGQSQGLAHAPALELAPTTPSTPSSSTDPGTTLPAPNVAGNRTCVN